MAALTGDIVVHRLGGKAPENFRLSAQERHLKPTGISVLLGGEPSAAAQQMLRAFPSPRRFPRLHALAKRVASSTVDQIRGVGFDVIEDPSHNFPNHALLIHPDGILGFDDAALQKLAAVFVEVQI